MDVHTTAQPPCRGVIEDMRSEQPEVGTRFQRDVLRSVMVCQHDQGDEVVRLADERARAFRFVRPARLVCIQIELIQGTQTTIFAHCLIPCTDCPGTPCRRTSSSTHCLAARRWARRVLTGGSAPLRRDRLAPATRTRPTRSRHSSPCRLRPAGSRPHQRFDERLCEGYERNDRVFAELVQQVEIRLGELRARH